MKRLSPSLDNPWFVTALFTVMALAFTWPLPTKLTTGIAGDLGDPVFNCWVMMWTGGQVLRFLSGDWHALADYWNGNIFYAEPLTIAYSEHLTPQMLQILPLYAITGNMVLCYNVLFLSAIVLSGLGMYLLVKELTGEPVAAFVAGAAFAFSPYRVDQFSHLQTMSSQWMPLALYGFRRYFTAGNLRALIGGAAAVVTQILSCGYFMFFFTPFAAAFYLHEMWSSGAWRLRRTWIHTAAVAVAAGLCILPFVLPYVAARAQTGISGVRSLDEIRLFSADTWSIGMTIETLTWLGQKLVTRNNGEGHGFPGFGTLALGTVGVGVIAAAAFAYTRKKSTTPAPIWRRATAIVLGIAGLALFAAWAWLLVWGGGVLRGEWYRFTVKTIPELAIRSAICFALAFALLPGFRRFLQGTPRSVGGFLILGWIAAMSLAWGPAVTAGGKYIGTGPYMLLYKYLPGFNGMRVPGRFFMVAIVFSAALAGIGLAAILKRWRKTGWTIAAGAVCLTLAESAVVPFIVSKPIEMDHYRTTPTSLASSAAMSAVYKTVKSLPAGTVLLEFPYAAPSYDIQTVYYAGYHRKPILNGYSGFFPKSFDERIPTLAWDPTENRDGAWAALSRSGATHVVVHEAAYLFEKGENISRWLKESGAKELVADGTDRLFALK